MSRIMLRYAIFGPGVVALVLGFFLPACSKAHEQPAPSAAASAPVGTPSVPHPAESSAPPPSASAAPTREAPTALAPRSEGADFVASARALFRVAACAETGEIPARLDEKVVAHNCEKLRPAYEKYEKGYLATATAFLGTIRPPNLPRRVVYPFGGGDLVTALMVFPDADEITTISLEPAGDVRRIDSIAPERLRGALRITGYGVLKLVGITYSNTMNLERDGHASLPGEIVLHLAALVVHGYEPTSLRYFRIEADGSLHYLSAEEVLAEGTKAHADPEGSRAPFANVELRFKKAGSVGGTEATEKVLRHISQDLGDGELGKTPGLRAYLDSRGQVSVMTKAASHLLWSDQFSIIRNFLLDHAVWMVSDSTGVPPRFASAAGFVQETYGTFDGPAHYGPVEALDSAAFRKLFAENPPRPLPMQFGYTDRRHHGHLVVMHKAAGAVAAPPPAATPSASAAPSATPSAR